MQIDVQPLTLIYIIKLIYIHDKCNTIVFFHTWLCRNTRRSQRNIGVHRATLDASRLGHVIV